MNMGGVPGCKQELGSGRDGPFKSFCCPVVQVLQSGNTWINPVGINPY